MKSIVRFVLVAAIGSIVVGTASDADARCRLFKKFRGNNCCEPTSCCEPAPCCEAEPVCCEPEPVCCEPEPCCCKRKRCGLFSRLHNRRNRCCESSCGCEATSDCGCGAVHGDGAVYEVHEGHGVPTEAASPSEELREVPEPPVGEEGTVFKGGTEKPADVQP